MIPLVAAGIIGGAGSVLSGLFASGAAGKLKEQQKEKKLGFKRN